MTHAMVEPPAVVQQQPPSTMLAVEWDDLDEEEQGLVKVLGIGAFVIVSPIIGIQGARKAISDVKEGDDDRFRANDPRK